MTTTITCRQAAWLIGGSLLLFAAGSNVTASESYGLGWQHLCEGKCTACATPRHAQGDRGKPWVNQCVRAGDPHRIAWYAKPSRNKHDSPGYVGGNATWRGEPRLPDEGTWGLDFAGVFSKNRIWLKWLHGRPSRHTAGSYATDGPRLLSP